MKRLQKLAAVSIGAVALSLGACAERVEVPPAHKGKILTKNGYKPETVSPSKFRLDWCWWYCDKLVRTPDGWRIQERVEEGSYFHNVPPDFQVQE